MSAVHKTPEYRKAQSERMRAIGAQNREREAELERVRAVRRAAQRERVRLFVDSPAFAAMDTDLQQAWMAVFASDLDDDQEPA